MSSVRNVRDGEDHGGRRCGSPRFSRVHAASCSAEGQAGRLRRAQLFWVGGQSQPRLLRKLVQKEQAKDLVCDFHQMAVRLAHLAQRHEHGRQPGTARCRGWVARGVAWQRGLAGAGKEDVQVSRLIACWAKALTDKGQSAASSPKTKTKRSYGSFTLDDAEAVDDVEEDGDDVKAAPAKKSNKTKKADVDEDDEDLEAGPAKKGK